MANTAFNYSKWDKIELSDDESDLHPNIDKDSWFRLKHRTRIEREEKEDQEIKVYNENTKQDNARLTILNARIKVIESGQGGEDAELEDIEAMKIEVAELNQNIANRNKRIAEITERRKWNIDNICQTKEEKTIVNSKTSASLHADAPLVDKKASSSSAPTTVFSSATSPAASSDATTTAPAAKASAPAPAATPTETSTTKASAVTKAIDAAPLPARANVDRDRLAAMNYNDYVLAHENLLETYSEIQDLENTKNFLFKNCDVLLHEHAQSYMLLSCLEDEMNGKKKRMRLVCRQSQILTHIQELGVSMGRDPRDVILPFFSRVEDKTYFQGFASAVDDFILRIQKRAVEKRKEMDAEEARASVGPGGLDPMEVFESLPQAMQDAFQEQNTAKLQAVLAAMDPFEAKRCMKKCVDSGLWVPQDASVFDDEEGGLEVVEEEEEEMID